MFYKTVTCPEPGSPRLVFMLVVLQQVSGAALVLTYDVIYCVDENDYDSKLVSNNTDVCN